MTYMSRWLYMIISNFQTLMQIIHTKKELKSAIKAQRDAGKIIGFVPTMGALHAGHLSLVDIAKSKADIVVVSIFVNKAQFAPHEDFAKYPRPLQSDIAMLQTCGTNIAYLPLMQEMYPEDFSTSIDIGLPGQILEGAFRPHFFAGVMLVVSKLFMQIAPDIAVFGEKDYQQLVLIKKMVAELDIPIEIIGAPVLRENDGLAMSSRNIYLSKEAREIAANLYKILLDVKEKLRIKGAAAPALSWGENALLKAGFEQVDYLVLCNAKTLQQLPVLQKPARLIATARLGGVRLLDNIAV